MPCLREAALDALGNVIPRDGVYPVSHCRPSWSAFMEGLMTDLITAPVAAPDLHNSRNSTFNAFIPVHLPTMEFRSWGDFLLMEQRNSGRCYFRQPERWYRGPGLDLIRVCEWISAGSILAGKSKLFKVLTYSRSGEFILPHILEIRGELE